MVPVSWLKDLYVCLSVCSRVLCFFLPPDNIVNQEEKIALLKWLKQKKHFYENSQKYNRNEPT